MMFIRALIQRNTLNIIRKCKINDNSEIDKTEQYHVNAYQF